MKVRFTAFESFSQTKLNETEKSFFKFSLSIITSSFKDYCFEFYDIVLLIHSLKLTYKILSSKFYSINV